MAVSFKNPRKIAICAGRGAALKQIAADKADRRPAGVLRNLDIRHQRNRNSLVSRALVDPIAEFL